MAQRSPAERRKPTRIISEDEIFDAAVALVDAEGLAALSMRRLADATGVAPMTIYGFVANKDALLARLGTHVLRELPPPLDAGAPWRDRARHELLSLRAAFDRHGGLLELLSVGDATPVLDGMRERLVGTLRASGADDKTVVEGLGTLIALTLGFSVGSRVRHVGLHDDSYKRLTQLSPSEYPNLTGVAQKYESHWSAAAFEKGLDALLDAIAATAESDELTP